MSTHVRIEVLHADKMVIVERSDGLYPRIIKGPGDHIFEFVEGLQTLTIKEVSVETTMLEGE